MWRRIKKWRALRAYKSTLATKLRARYGREKHYTPEQVRRCAADSGVSTTFLCFAFAMYCDRDTFDAYHRAEGEACDYDAMRVEVGSALGIDSGSHDSFDASQFVDSVDLHHHTGGGGGNHDGFFDGGDGSD